MSSGIRPGTRAGCRTRPGSNSAGCDGMQVKDPAQAEPWKPVLNSGLDLRELPLTPEEGFVASRLDGITNLHGLSVVAGLSPERIEAALERLVPLGAVAPPEALDEDEPVATEEPAGTHRKLYETALRQLAPEERAAREIGRAH